METYKLLGTISTLVVFLLSRCMAEEECLSGRIHFGNINESFPEYLDMNGVYNSVAGLVNNGKPVYKHQVHELFIFFVRTDLDSYWVVAPVLSNDNLSEVKMSMRSRAARPTSVEHWRVRTSSGTWRHVPKLTATCVSSDFDVCRYGRISLSGLSRRSRGLLAYMGAYALQNITRSLRPVYVQENGTGVLHYRHHMWVISDGLHSRSLVTFVKDHAFRPEFIKTEWVVFNGFFLSHENIRVTCEGNDNLEASNFNAAARHGCSATHLQNHNNGEDSAETGSHNGSKILAAISTASPEEGGADRVLPTDEQGLLENTHTASWRQRVGCQVEPVCQNGGEMLTVTSEAGQVACRCKPGFTGRHCENEVQCGEPPVVQRATLERVIDNGFLSLAFYHCDAGFYTTTGMQAAAVCGSDARWHHLPACRSHMDIGDHWREAVPYK